MVCNKCQIEKPESEYNWKYKELGIRAKHCRACQCEYKKRIMNEIKRHTKPNHKEQMLSIGYGTLNISKNILPRIHVLTVASKIW